jgi:hypothetical protein
VRLFSFTTALIQRRFLRLDKYPLMTIQIHDS